MQDPSSTTGLYLSFNVESLQIESLQNVFFKNSDRPLIHKGICLQEKMVQGCGYLYDELWSTWLLWLNMAEPLLSTTDEEKQNRNLKIVLKSSLLTMWGESGIKATDNPLGLNVLFSQILNPVLCRCSLLHHRINSPAQRSFSQESHPIIWSVPAGLFK